MSSDTEQEAIAELGRLLGGTLGKLLYVSRSRPSDDAPGPPPMSLAVEHVRYLKDLEARGILYGGGGFVDETDGRLPESLIVIRAQTIEEATSIIEADPMNAGGYRTFELQRWRVNLGSVGVAVTFSDQQIRFD